MNHTSEEMVEIKAGDLFSNVPFTPEGMKVVQAMVGLLDVQVEGMNHTSEEMVKIKAGDLFSNVPFTPEGMKVVQAMVRLLDVQVGVEVPVMAAENPSDGGGEVQPKTTPIQFSPSQISSPVQRLRAKGWKAIAKVRTGLIYKEVVDRLLEEYVGGVEPENKIFSKLIREMYGNQLKDSSINTYVGVYRSYIRKNKLSATTPPQKKYKPKGEELLPIEKVVEVWDLLPDKFLYKDVRALVPTHIMQSQPRIETSNFLIKQFLAIPEFGCKETEPGVFVKMGEGEEEEEGEGEEKR